jgi:hypothetical protein
MLKHNLNVAKWQVFFHITIIALARTHVAESNQTDPFIYRQTLTKRQHTFLENTKAREKIFSLRQHMSTKNKEIVTFILKHKLL